MLRSSIRRRLLAAVTVVSLLVSGCAVLRIIGRIVLEIGMQVAVTEGEKYVERWIHGDKVPQVPTVTIVFTDISGTQNTVIYTVQRIKTIAVKGLQGNVSINGSACAWAITVAAGTTAQVEISGEEGDSIHCDGAIPLPSATQGPTLETQPPATVRLPDPFMSEGGVPQSTTMVISPETGTVHVLTSGPIRVLGVKLPGGVTRGSVVVFLPGASYQVSDLVPRQNWHGAYRLAASQWQLVVSDRVDAMLTTPNCTTGRCATVDWLVVGPTGVVARSH